MQTPEEHPDTERFLFYKDLIKKRKNVNKGVLWLDITDEKSGPVYPE